LARVKQLADSLKGRGNNEVLTALKAYLMKLNFIVDVYTPGQLNSKIVSNDKFLVLYKKSRRSDRVARLPFFSLNNFQSEIGRWGMMVRLKESSND